MKLVLDIRKTLFSPALAALVLACPALAGEPAASGKKGVTAADIAQSPMEDLNLKKNPVPPALASSILHPYSLEGISTCPDIASAVDSLGAVLGDDVDLPLEGGRHITAGQVAQSVTSSFIPFRGVIREVTGASARKRDLEAAVLAGIARRAFLKGYGQARGCGWPARGISPSEYTSKLEALNAKAATGGK